MPTPSWSFPYKELYQHVNTKKEPKFEYPLSNFGSFSYFQTFFSLGVKQGLQKLPKCDINDLRHSFHCNILISRKCPRKTLFKAQCDGPWLRCYKFSLNTGWELSNPPPISLKNVADKGCSDTAYIIKLFSSLVYKAWKILKRFHFPWISRLYCMYSSEGKTCVTIS